MAWAATIGVQLDFANFQLGVSDLMALPLAIWVSFLMLKRPLTFRGTVAGLLAFAGVFWTFGNLVAVLYMGYLPTWTYLNKDVGLIEMLVCVAGIITITDSRAILRQLLLAFVAGGSILNAAGLMLIGVTILTGFGKFVIYQDFRYTGFIPNPNAWAYYLAVIALFQLCLLVFRKTELLRVRPALQWANFALLITGIIATLSRSGALALLFGLFCLLFFVPAKVGVRVIRTLLVLAVGLLVILWQSGALPRVTARIVEEGDSGRTAANRIAWSMYTSSPITMLTGIGIGTFLETAVEPGYQFELHNTAQIHNTFYWLLVEGGPLLLTLFLVLFGSGVRAAWRLARMATFEVWGVAVFVSLMTSALFFAANEGMYQRQFWLLLAVADVLLELAQRPRVLLTLRARPAPQTV